VNVKSIGPLQPEDVERMVLPELRGHVFHVTTEQGFHGIQASGAVTANTAGLLPFTCSQSAVSYFRKNGCVSLIDLRDISDENLHDGIRKYYFFQPFRSSRVVFLILKSTGYPGIISWEVSRSEGVGAMIVPYLEAGYQDEIPLEHIELALIVDVASNQANAMSLP